MTTAWKFLLGCSLAAGSCLRAQTIAAVAQDGLVVGQPKVYDTYYLQQQLLALRTQLEHLQALDRGSLVGRFGNAQGGTLEQNAVAAQASGPSTPTVTTATGGSSPGTQVATTPLAAANPTISPTSLALPTPAMGASDTLAEEVQLQYQITNLELLLDGAVSDRITPGGQPRRALTIGFPISIAPPDQTTAPRRANSVAQIMVSLCRRTSDGPDVSIGTLLPQEHTYNVAGLVDNSFAASAGGVLGGVLSVGGGFLHRKQSYFLVQQQETVAFQTASMCGSDYSGPGFAWQIRPVLGSKQVRSGMQTNFVQFTLDDVDHPVFPMGEILRACVRAGWSRTSAHGTVIRNPAEREGAACFPVIQYPPQVMLGDFKIANLAGADLLLEARGTFEPGTTIKVGAATLPAAGVVIAPTAARLEAALPAGDWIKAGGASLLARDGTEVAIQHPGGRPGDQPVSVGDVSAVPLSSDRSRVTIDFYESVLGSHPAPCTGLAACDPRFDPWIVVAGGKIYGLADAPFLSNVATPVLSASAPVHRVVQLVLPTALLHSDAPIMLERPFYDPILASARLPAAKFATAAASGDMPSFDKATVLSTDHGMRLAIRGGGLDGLALQFPNPGANAYVALQPGFAEVTLDAATVENLKQIVLCRPQGAGCDPNYPPLVIDLPKSGDAASPAAAPQLKEGASIAAGAASVELDGTLLDQISLIQYAGQKLTFRVVGTEKPQIALDLPPAISSRQGTYPLVVTASDGKTALYSLVVK